MSDGTQTNQPEQQISLEEIESLEEIVVRFDDGDITKAEAIFRLTT